MSAPRSSVPAGSAGSTPDPALAAGFSEESFRVDLHGVRLGFQGDSDRLCQEALLFLGAHRDAGTGPPDYVVRFVEVEQLPGGGVFPGPGGPGEGSVVREGSRWVLRAAEGVVFLDPEARLAQGYVRPMPAVPDVQHSAVSLVHLLVQHIMWQEGFLPTHAAAVVHEQEALLLAGRSGVGKSTLALTLGRLGCSLICDDLVYLQPREGRWHVGGHRQPIKVLSQEVPAWMQPWPRFAGRSGVIGKDLVAAPPSLSEERPGVRPVKAVFFLERGAAVGSAPALQACDPAEVVFRLMEASPLSVGEMHREAIIDFLGAAASPRCYRVEVADDPGRTAAGLLAVLTGEPGSEGGDR